MPVKQDPDWPVRGTPGAWIDAWDDPDPVAAAQDQAARVAGAADPIVQTWRAESAKRAAQAEARRDQPSAARDPAPPTS